MEISTPVYVNPLSDSGFKAIFCDPANKSDLIALLNVFLRPAGRQVEDLEYATTELPGVALSNKASRVDLRCTDGSGRRFIVEVQRGAQPHFFRRCVYYASRIYALGSERGDGGRYEILPVYLVALTDRDFGFARGGREWFGRYTSVYTFREKSTGQEEDETISIIFVELNRFEKGSYGECASDEERWCWMLKNMSGMGRSPGDAGATLELLPELEHLLESGRIAGFSREKRTKYDADMITERDYQNILATAREQGHDAGFAEGREAGRAEGEARGIERGRAAGLAEGKAEIARKLLVSGMPEAQVAEFTGLTAEQLEELK